MRAITAHWMVTCTLALGACAIDDPPVDNTQTDKAPMVGNSTPSVSTSAEASTDTLAGATGATGPVGPIGPAGLVGATGPRGQAVFSSCVLRFHSLGVACASGELLTGGGCISSGTIKSSYPTPQDCFGCTPASWQCDGTTPLTAYAICCS